MENRPVGRPDRTLTFEVKVEKQDLSGVVRVYETTYLGVGGDPVTIVAKRNASMGGGAAIGFEHSSADSFFIWVKGGDERLNFGFIPTHFTKSIFREAQLLRTDSNLLRARAEFDRVTALEASTRALRAQLVTARERQILSDLHSRIEGASKNCSNAAVGV